MTYHDGMPKVMGHWYTPRRVFERYMTAQSKITIILAAIPMPALNNTAAITAMLITLYTDAGVKINIVLLDRGYSMVDVIKDA